MSGNLGLVRAGAAVPTVKVANTTYNSQEMIRLIQAADKEKAGFLVFPELCITGATCGDLFFQEHLYQSQLAALSELCKAIEPLKVSVVLGCYLRLETGFYNCAVLIQRGRIKGIVPKLLISDSGEGRWFTPGAELVKVKKSVSLFGQPVPFGNLIFENQSSGLSVALEVCGDLGLPVSPGSQLALNGAQVIFNLAAGKDIVGEAAFRRNLVMAESAKNRCGYVYTSAGVTESTTDSVFGGHSILAENGTILEESTLFKRTGQITYSEIDVGKIQFDRSRAYDFHQCAGAFTQRGDYTHVGLEPVSWINETDKPYRKYPQNPFVPETPGQLDQRCQEIFHIQSAGLAKRMEHTHSEKTVVGISGGLDSTLALLVCAHVHKILDLPAGGIIAVTMPGFGTTGKTYHNALTIMRLLGASIREISIKESISQHFADIGHPPELHDVTYENAQARERTQILMDIGNKEGGLVVGTGDLSETALGWCTYNGDHMSMYGVNAGVPKTLVRLVVKWIMENGLGDPDENTLLKETLQDILNTPISPELLPPDSDGNMVQKTEDSVGPYALHEFFLYYTLRCGMAPNKLLFIARNAFAGAYNEAFIKKWLTVFYQRFFAQQFKRNCVPDGPKIGSVGLSPRGDWQMPSDADAETWLQ